MTRLALPAAVALALVLGTPAGGAPSWGGPRQISAGDRALGPELALDAAGGGLVVWDQEVGSVCPTEPASLSCIHVVQATRRLGDGTWQAPVEISRPGIGARPVAAVDDAGDAAIIWAHDIGRDRVLQATLRKGSSGAFPEPNDVSEPSLEVRSHQVALDATGNAIAVWAERSREILDVFGAFRESATGAWFAPTRLSSPEWGASEGPDLALTPDGRVAVAWVDGRNVVWVALGDAATRTWGAPTALSGSELPARRAPTIAMNAAGEIAVAWEQRDRTQPTGRVQSRARSRAGAWSEVVDLGTTGSTMDEPQIAVDANGGALVVWVGPSGVLRAASRPAAGAWKMHDVSGAPRVYAQSPRLAIDTAGNAVVVWRDGDHRPLRSAIRPASSGNWQPPTDVSASTWQSARVAMDHMGRAVAVWNRSSSQAVVVEAADYTGKGPLFEDFVVSKAASTGRRARFSIRAVPWAAPLVGVPRWTFGDGATARGTHVAHVYARPGSFAVTVTQVDARGDVSTATAEVRVAAPARNLRRPSIAGSPTVGATLTCRRGTWTGSPPATFAYLWRRNGVTVPRTSSRRLHLVATHAGSRIVCVVTATNRLGPVRAASPAVRIRG